MHLQFGSLGRNVLKRLIWQVDKELISSTNSAIFSWKIGELKFDLIQSQLMF